MLRFGVWNLILEGSPCELKLRDAANGVLLLLLQRPRFLSATVRKLMLCRLKDRSVSPYLTGESSDDGPGWPLLFVLQKRPGAAAVLLTRDACSDEEISKRVGQLSWPLRTGDLVYHHFQIPGL